MDALHEQEIELRDPQSRAAVLVTACAFGWQRMMLKKDEKVRISYLLLGEVIEDFRTKMESLHQEGRLSEFEWLSLIGSPKLLVVDLMADRRVVLYALSL